MLDGSVPWCPLGAGRGCQSLPLGSGTPSWRRPLSRTGPACHGHPRPPAPGTPDRPFPLAANYSMPVVSAPSSTPQGQELTFTCTSTDGYPRPNVYWINRTDNSLLDQALQNSTVTLNARGLYDVVSVLRIRRTPNVAVGCCIENVLLLQNLTVGSQTGTGKVPAAAVASMRLWPRVTGESLSGRGQSRCKVTAVAPARRLDGRGRGSPVCGDDVTGSHRVGAVAHFVDGP